MRYLENRGILETAGRKVWAFVGDGEMDEPESLAGPVARRARGARQPDLRRQLQPAAPRRPGARQRLRSSRSSRACSPAPAGTSIKLLWGSDWDPLFARDDENVILRRLHETVDGEFQKYAATDGRFNREHFFNKYPELQEIVAHLSDEDIDRLRRGGHDPVKIYAAYHAAVNHKRPADRHPRADQERLRHGPLGPGHDGRAPAEEARGRSAARVPRPLRAAALRRATCTQLRFYKPGRRQPRDALSARAARGARRLRAGARARRRRRLPVPALDTFRQHPGRLAAGARSRPRWCSCRCSRSCCKDAKLGKRIVPIVADEARTFGMQSLFRQVGDLFVGRAALRAGGPATSCSTTRKRKDGQILEEGITEAGAMSSWIAAATSYSAHGVPMLPFYIFYSMFGFQRVGDLVWAAADSRARGFLIGATAGRTTLVGRRAAARGRLQPLAASTVPNCVAYDPCFGYELAAIVQDGMRRMLEEQRGRLLLRHRDERELRAARAMPDGARAKACMQGHVSLARDRPPGAKRRVQLLGLGHDPARSARRGRRLLRTNSEHRRPTCGASRASPSCAAKAWTSSAGTRLHPDESPRES